MAQPGQTLSEGRYRLERPLGEGGFGATWLAEDTHAEVPALVLAPDATVEPGMSLELPPREAMPEQVRGPLSASVVLWGVVLLGSALVPWVYPLGMLGTVGVVVGAGLISVLIGGALLLDINHPASRLIQKRRELVLWCALIMPALAVQYVGIGASATTDSGFRIISSVLLALLYLFLAVIPGTILDAIYAFARHMRSERVVGAELPIPDANTSPTIPFEVVEIIPGERLELRQERTGWLSLGLWLWHLALVFIIALIRPLLGLSEVVSGDVAGGGMMAIALLLVCGALASWLKGRRALGGRSLVIDRLAGQVSWESDSGAALSAPLASVRKWSVSHVVGEIHINAERDGQRERIWTLPESTPRLRVEECAQLERLIGQLFSVARDEPAELVTFDLIHAKTHTRQDASAREVEPSITTR